MVTALTLDIAAGFKMAGFRPPEDWFYSDLYQDADGKLFYRVSLYVGTRVTYENKLRGTIVAALLERLTNHSWVSYECIARSRPSNSIKVWGKYELSA